MEISASIFSKPRKKGNAVLDIALFMIIIVVFAIASILGYKVFTEINTDISAEMTNTQANATLQETGGRYPAVLDGLVILVFLGLWAMVLVASFMVDSHPIFFIFSVILIFFMIIAGIFLGNFYEEFFSDSEFTGLTATFPATNWILTHLLPIVIAISISILIVLYGKSKL